MRFEFSRVELPEIEDRLSGQKYNEFKVALVAVLLTQRAQVFADESSADGPWKALSQPQAAKRLGKVPVKNRKKANAVKILQDTGLLRSSFSDAEGPGKSQLEQIIEQDEVGLATNVEYAAIQNFGGTVHIPENKNGFNRGITIPAHDVTIPARPFDQFTEANEAEINELTELYLNGEL